MPGINEKMELEFEEEHDELMNSSSIYQNV